MRGAAGTIAAGFLMALALAGTARAADPQGGLRLSLGGLPPPTEWRASPGLSLSWNGVGELLDWPDAPTLRADLKNGPVDWKGDESWSAGLTLSFGALEMNWTQEMTGEDVMTGPDSQAWMGFSFRF